MYKKLFNKFTAFLLCLITAVGCSVMVISTPKTAKAASGDNETPSDDFISHYYYEDEALEFFLENQLDQSYEEEMRIYEKYKSYIFLTDNGCLNYEELPMYKLYPELILLDYDENPYDIEDDEELITALGQIGINSDDIQNILEERLIVGNINLMNDAVDEGIGYIDNDTLIIVEDPFFAENLSLRWKAWGFKITWYQLSVNFDSDFAFVFSLVFLTGSIFAGGLDDIIDILKSENTDELFDSIKNIIEDKFYSDFVELINGEFIDFVLSLISEIDNVIGKSAIFKKVVVFLLKRMMPPVTDCIIIFLNSIYKGKGMYLAFCWIPWKGKFGFTIRSI